MRMVPVMAHTYEHAFSVGPGDIDGLGHVNNLVYLRWIQEVAAAHWSSVARAEDRSAIVWVVVRHEIDYVKPAFEGDGVVARTWVESWHGATSDRRTEVRRAADGEVLARARTVWCALDAASRRPRRLAAAVSTPFAEEDA